MRAARARRRSSSLCHLLLRALEQTMQELETDADALTVGGGEPSQTLGDVLLRRSGGRGHEALALARHPERDPPAVAGIGRALEEAARDEIVHELRRRRVADHEVLGDVRETAAAAVGEEDERAQRREGE